MRIIRVQESRCGSRADLHPCVSEGVWSGGLLLDILRITAGCAWLVGWQRMYQLRDLRGQNLEHFLVIHMTSHDYSCP